VLQTKRLQQVYADVPQSADNFWIFQMYNPENPFHVVYIPIRYSSLRAKINRFILGISL
jgi:hypothetical protein